MKNLTILSLGVGNTLCSSNGVSESAKVVAELYNAQTAEQKAADLAAQSLAYIKGHTVCVVALPKGHYADLKASAKGLFKTIKSEMLHGLKHELFARKAAEISAAMVGSNDKIVDLAGKMLAAAGRNAGCHMDEGAIVASASTLTEVVEVCGTYFKSSFAKK